jgi:hypothetical protein
MRIGAFEVTEPLPELRNPQVFAMLKPWIDVGSVGSLTLDRLETAFAAKELARLARPGNFFDFTRYRPMMRNRGEIREVVVPNTTVSCTRRESGDDFILLRLLEPHMLGEDYTESIWQVLRTLGIKRYTLIGGMYDMVPHTRPLLISGGSSDKTVFQKLQRVGVYQSNYQGPTTICHLISEYAQRAGVDTMSLIVHLPQYTEFDEDYAGLLAILRSLQMVYDISISESDIQRAEKQNTSIEAALQNNRKLKSMLAQLETHYDAHSSRDESAKPQLSGEVEDFLKEMENKFKDN